MAGASAEAAAVDQRLRMLDADADRERLGLDGDAAVVAASGRCRARCGRPPARRDRPRCCVPSASTTPRTCRLPSRRSLDVDVRRPCSRSDTRRRALRSSARMLSTIVTSRKVPMCGLATIEDFGRRAGLDELGQHLAAVVVRVLDLAVELAVGERAGAAFAELHVGFRVEHRPAPQAPGVLGALAHDLAALEDDRPEAHLRQDQAGEQAARAGADHDRPRRAVAAARCAEAIAHVGRGRQLRSPAKPLQHRRLVPHLDVERIDQRDGRALARVDRAAEHANSGPDPAA